VLPANLSNWFSHLRLRWRQAALLAITAIAVMIGIKIATITSIFNAFIHGELDPLPVHVVLIGIAILAEIAVARGIVLEAPPPEKRSKREKWGIRLVLWGVILSALFTILLFVFDEGISNRQQARIIVLESPRTFSPSTEFASVGKQYLAGIEFDLTAENSFEPMTLALAVRKQLLAIGMVERLSNASNHWSPPNGGLPVGEIIRPGIAVRSCDSQTAESNRPTPARILGALLSDSGLGSKEAPVFVEPAAKDDCAKAPDVLHVEVGEKIVLPWTPPPGTVVVHPKFQLEVTK
jgi:hypothetical protein